LKKKWLAFLLVGGVFLIASLPSGVMAAELVTVTFNDKKLDFDVSPILENGRALVPLRVIFEALGAKVDWDGATNTVTATKDNDTVKLTVGKKTAYKNGAAIELDVPAKVVKGKTLVPIRFVSEAMGTIVNYQHDTKTVIIQRIKHNTVQLETLDYHIPQYTSNIEWNIDNIIWKEDNITLIANKSLAKEKYLSNSVIISIMIKKENKNFEIMFTEKPLSISSVGLSANKDYLALKLFYHYGYKVLVVNLNTGEHFILNDMLKTAKNGFVETIHAYSWSPDKNKLAFAFGNTSKSNLAIYDLDKNLLLLIPTENYYITTAYILWHRNGEGLDFVSEYPSKKFKVYRYFNNQDSIEFIRAVSREEIVNMPSPNYRFKY